MGNYVSGGKSVRSDSWPWHIQLNIAGNSRNDSETYCGATLISKRFILTAAHCYDDLLPHKRARHTLIVAKGVEVLYDDRDARAGEKFADSDLLGIPTRIVVGRDGVATDSFEVVDRKSGVVTKKSRAELV